MSLDRLRGIALEATKGGFYVFIGNFIQLIVSVISPIIIARLLGPVGYGQYRLVLVIPFLLFSILSLNINAALIRFIARLKASGESATIRKYVFSGMFFAVVVGSIASIVCLIFSPVLARYVLNRPSLAFLIKYASTLTLFLILFTILTSILIGLGKYSGFTLVSIIRVFTWASLSIALVVLGYGVIGAILGFTIGYLVASILALTLVLRHTGVRDRPDGLELTRCLSELLVFSLPLYGATLVRNFINYYGNIVLAWHVSDYDIGNYNVVVGFAGMINVLINPIAMVLLSAFSKLDYRKNPHEVSVFFDYVVRYIVLIMAPIVVLVSMLSWDLVPLVYGKEYTHAPQYLSVHVLTPLLVGLGLVFRNFFSSIGRTDMNFKLSIVQLVISIPLFIVSVRLYGVMGVIVSALIANLIVLAIGFYIAMKFYGVGFNVSKLLRILAVLIVATLISYPFTRVICYGYDNYIHVFHLLRILVITAIFVVAYIVLLPLLRAIGLGDLNNIRVILDNIRLLKPVFKPLIDFEEKLIRIMSR